MNPGEITRRILRATALSWAAAMLALAPQAASAQDAPGAVALEQQAQGEADLPGAGTAEGVVATTEDVHAGEVYTQLPPSMIKGQPELGSVTFQEQFSPQGDFALWMHDAILLPLIVAICLFVLGLLLWVVAKYRRREHVEPSKTSHNTLIEVIWTLVPVLILVAIAIPSITLLARQYESPPAEAVTIKATGYQWYWGYTYPDNGGFEIISNMLDENEAVRRGEPGQLAVDNRMVVPAGEWLRIQTTGADVIHAFAIPSLWFKIDAVPGRLNERRLFIEEPGIYYGQCSELCGARHAYMPIAIEALPRPQWEAWVRAQGGTVGDEAEAAEPELSIEPEATEIGGPIADDTAVEEVVPTQPEA